MAFNKLNRLHLHCTDAQSWPLEIPTLPNLAKEGAYSEDQIWSVNDLKQVQEHGLYHGVEVYLEIDLPGHTASIHHSHPHLITAYNASWATYACHPPAGQLPSTFLTCLLFQRPSSTISSRGLRPTARTSTLAATNWIAKHIILTRLSGLRLKRLSDHSFGGYWTMSPTLCDLAT